MDGLKAEHIEEWRERDRLANIRSIEYKFYFFIICYNPHTHLLVIYFFQDT